MSKANKKYAKYHILAAKVFSDENDRRDWLEQNFGKRSILELSAEEQSRAIKLLEKVAPTTTYQTATGSAVRPRRSSPINYAGKGNSGRQKFLTQNQADRIWILEKMLSWDKNVTYTFIYRQLKKVKGVEMLMNYEANKVIVGMQHVFCDKTGAEYSNINKLTNQKLLDLLNKIGEDYAKDRS